MQTRLSAALLETADGREADAILRKCVHCGFCTATCPTYQLLGDELDGPRGRIYLMQQVLEGAPVTAKTQLHLDRCLTCRSCETTCPSGVRYGRLLDIGRRHVDEQVPRRLWQRLQRRLLLLVLPNRSLFGALLWLGRLFRPLLPGKLRRAVPPRHPAGAWPAPRHARRMLLLCGCVQPAIAPNIDAAAVRVLDRAGVSLVSVRGAAGCCGALAHHLSAEEMALEQARRNIDAWWPEIERGAESLLVTASGCGTMVKDYGTLLREDPRYADKAAKVSALFRDLSVAVAAEAAKPPRATANQRIAVHSPCSLQHGLQIRGVVEELLRSAGFIVLPVKDAHLCCGSAGTYSILQPELSRQLRTNKLAALEADDPELIVTANIGCLTHLGAGTARPVRHWIEVLDEALSLSS